MSSVDSIASFEGTLYVAVRQHILDNIRSLKWPSGTKLPPEGQLAREFGVSIGTLRKAVDELVSERLLVRRPGRGTFVSGTSREEFLNSIFNFVDSQGQRVSLDARIISVRAGAPDGRARRTLQLDRGDRVMWIDNLRLLGGEPVILDRIQIPLKLFPTLTPAAFTKGLNPRTVFDVLAEHAPYSIVRVEETLTAVLPDAAAADALNITRETPLLRVERVALSFGDLPVELRYRFVSSTMLAYHNVIGIKV